MNWYEVKRATLQRMFALQVSEIVTNSNNAAYLAAMPAAANEGLQLLAGVGRGIVKQLEIWHNPPPGEAQVRYALRALAPDFGRILSEEVFLNTAQGSQKASYTLEGEDTLVLQRKAVGMYRVWYSAQPPVMRPETPDETPIPLQNGGAELLPLYIASQLYKEDDFAMATSYRNEFEAGLEKLVKTQPVLQNEAFESGWV